MAVTAQKMKFPIEELFSKCDQIRRKLWIASHLLEKFLIENLCLPEKTFSGSFHERICTKVQFS